MRIPGAGTLSLGGHTTHLFTVAHGAGATVSTDLEIDTVISGTYVNNEVAITKMGAVGSSSVPSARTPPASPTSPPAICRSITSTRILLVDRSVMPPAFDSTQLVTIT